MITNHPPIRTIRDIEALERVPLAERLEFQCTYEVIQAGAASDPDKPGIIFYPNGDPDETPEVRSFGDVLGGITRTANLLRHLGVGPEDKVSYLLPTVPQMQLVLWGAQAAGIVSPINWMLEPDHIAHIIRSVGAKVLIALAPTPEFEIWEKVEAIRDQIPGVEHILQVTLANSRPAASLIFNELLQDFRADRLLFHREITHADVAACMHTGGTTGAPKLTKTTHGALIYQAWVMTLQAGDDADDVVWAAGPSYHIAILTGGGLGPLAKTMTMVNPGPMGFRHKKMLANHWVIMERHKMTRLFGIPTVLGAVVDLPPGDMDFSRLRFSTAVGAPMPVEVGRNLERLTGRKMGQAYGLTETASGIVYPPKDGEIRLGSSGLRRPYSEIKAVILDDAGELPVAYVQLRPGTEVTESELKEFVRARISERGANSADIYFLERIPLTGVGKVLRRDLRLDAAQRAFRALLAPLAEEGIDLSVEVADHATHGTLAKVIVSTGGDAVTQRIYQILEPFVIPHEIIRGLVNLPAAGLMLAKSAASR